jgi:hypothetical protein
MGKQGDRGRGRGITVECGAWRVKRRVASDERRVTSDERQATNDE